MPTFPSNDGRKGAGTRYVHRACGNPEAVNVNSVYSRKGSIIVYSRNFNGSWFDWSVCRDNWIRCV